jgi:hypothetical protein
MKTAQELEFALRQLVDEWLVAQARVAGPEHALAAGVASLGLDVAGAKY